MEKSQLEIGKYSYQQALDMVSEQVAIIDTKYRYVYVNKAYLFAHGKKYDEIHGEFIENVIGEDAFNNIIKPQLDACYRGEEVSYTGWIKFKKIKFRYMEVSYKALYDEEDHVSQIAIFYQDLTREQQLELSLKESKQIIAQINTTDWLTDLYNKNYFNEYFPKMLNMSQRNDQLLAFALLDVDYFKEYSDEFGQNAGENILKKIAISLKNRLRRPNDHIFRLERDEFAMLFHVNRGDDAINVAEDIRKKIESLQIDNPNNPNTSYITVSIGLLLLYPDDKYPVDQIYNKVAALLESAKENGKNQIRYN